MHIQKFVGEVKTNSQISPLPHLGTDASQRGRSNLESVCGGGGGGGGVGAGGRASLEIGCCNNLGGGGYSFGKFGIALRCILVHFIQCYNLHSCMAMCNVPYQKVGGLSPPLSKVGG